MNFSYITYYFEKIKNNLIILSDNKLDNLIIEDVLQELETILNKKHFFPINNDISKIYASDKLLLRRHNIDYELSLQKINNSLVFMLLPINASLDMVYYLEIDLNLLHASSKSIYFENNDLCCDLTDIDYKSKIAFRNYYTYSSIKDALNYYNIDIINSNNIVSLLHDNYMLEPDYEYSMDRDSNNLMPFKSLREKEKDTKKYDKNFRKVKMR